MPVMITDERPDSAAATELIAELELYLNSFYPPESQHGYSVEKLLNEGVAFFVARQDGIAVGCGAIKLVGSDHKGFGYGEIKRMYVRPTMRGLGLGRLMLEHLTTYARQQGIKYLRLETGIHQREAIGLYERMGFQRIGRFGDYPDDPLSWFYEKQIG